MKEVPSSSQRRSLATDVLLSSKWSPLVFTLLEMPIVNDIGWKQNEKDSLDHRNSIARATRRVGRLHCFTSQTSIEPVNSSIVAAGYMEWLTPPFLRLTSSGHYPALIRLDRESEELARRCYLVSPRTNLRRNPLDRFQHREKICRSATSRHLCRNRRRHDAGILNLA